MIDQKLRAHQIRPTQIRKTILDVFFSTDYALSHADVEKEVGDRCDRVTIYRTLEKFMENGLIHKVPGDANMAKYALCAEDTCDSHKHHDEHLHFDCVACGNTYCLSVARIPTIELPTGYQLKKMSLKAEGICKQCL